MKTCKIKENKIYISGEEIDIELSPESAIIPNFELSDNYKVSAETLATLLAAYNKCCCEEIEYTFCGNRYRLVPSDVVKDSVRKCLEDNIKKLKQEKGEIIAEKNIISNKNYLYASVIYELRRIIEKHNESSLFRKIGFDYETIVNKCKVKLALNQYE